MAMNNIVMTALKKLIHRPKMLQRMMDFIRNLDAIDSSLIESFQNLRIRFVLIQQIKLNIAHTGTIVQHNLF